MDNSASLPATTHIGQVSLAVADLDRSRHFYTEVLGFSKLEEDAHSAVLGTKDGQPLLRLEQRDGAVEQPLYSTGLYHVAILMPGRTELARSLAQMTRQHYPLSGFSDHLVSEALYLNDPDGNGLELYRDRPRAQWEWRDKKVHMDNAYLDVRKLVAEGLQSLEEQPWDGLAAGTTVGHIHLRVGDIRQAEQFYHGLLGFDVVSHMPSALFVSAGGYHHHIGLNTWQSQGAPQAPANSVGLQFFTIALEDAAAVQQVKDRLNAAGVAVEEQEHGIVTHDPWNNVILLSA